MTANDRRPISAVKPACGSSCSHPNLEYTVPGYDTRRVSKKTARSALTLPTVTSTVLDPAYQHAYGRLVAARLTEARLRLVAVHGDLYSQERVARRVGKTQSWLSNLELGQRRIDVAALLVLGAVYSVALERLVMPPTGPEEEAQMTQRMREYRALVRTAETRDVASGPPLARRARPAK
jgi:transcriptional regulator with XRE-family HTH domain